MVVRDGAPPEGIRRLFGSSGIRGVFEEDLSEGFYRDVARAVGGCLPPGSRVCIATDTRESGRAVRDAVVDGLRDTGTDVTALGILPTPVLAFATLDAGFDAGIMVTASHNPPEFNGLKLFNGSGIGFSDGQEMEIEAAFSEGRLPRAPRGSLCQDHGARERYSRFVRSRFTEIVLPLDTRIVVDPGGGAAAGFATELFSSLGLDVIPVNDAPDGRFRGRDPEPTEETLTGTARFLRQQAADLAVCFDGDADRVVFLDRDGFLGFNEMIAFASWLAVRRSGKARVATTVETGRLLDTAVSDLGAEVTRGRVGDVHVAHLARGLNAAIGVEPAGVYIMPETGLYPDSLMAALTLLRAIGAPGDVRRFLAQLPQLYSRQRKVPCHNGDKAGVMRAIVKSVPEFGLPRASSLDGLRMESDDAWLLIRASGTEPIIRVSAEAQSELRAEELASLGIQAVEAAAPPAPPQEKVA